MKQQIGILAALVILVGLFIGYQGVSKQVANIPPESQLAQVAPTSGLVGYWDLDGDVNDSQGGNNGSFNGPAWTTGKIGQAASLTGSNSISISDNGSLQLNNAYTYSYWLNLATSQNGYAGISSKTINGSVPQVNIQFDAGNNVNIQHDGTTMYPTGVTASNLSNGWHHLVVTYDGTTAVTYLDGTQRSANTIAKPATTGNGTLFIGQEETGVKLQGAVDEVRIYNRALSPTEIQSLYNYTGQTLTTITVFVYKGGTVTARDVTNGTNLTLNNTIYSNTTYDVYTVSAIPGNSVIFTETPTTGSFIGWTGSLSSSCGTLEPSCTVTVPASAASITANFTSTSGQTAAIISFSASPSTINAGQKSSLTWISKFTKSCTLNGGGWTDLSVPSSKKNKPTLDLNTTTTFTLKCLGPGTQAPERQVTVTVNSGPTISNVRTTNTTLSGATIAWSTNQASDSQVLYGLTSSYGSQTARNATMVTSHSVVVSGLAPNTLYHYAVRSQNAAGITSTSTDYTFCTNAGSDCTSPSVNITAPANGTIVSGISVTLSANASDNVGVAGVLFKVDGTTISPPGEDTLAPYTIPWNTTTVTEGSHTIVAVARDVAGNRASSTPITVTVSNTGFNLTLTKTGAGAGTSTVTPVPLGVSCGTNCWTYASGVSVELRAVPAIGYSTTWTGCDTTNGNTCTVNMTAPRAVTADFSVLGTAWYVRQNGPITTSSLTGGDSWTNAFSMAGLNANWSRIQAGHVVCLAGGTTAYTQYINVGASGTSDANRITIKKATGTDPLCGQTVSGWQTSYGNQAVIDAGVTGIKINGRSYVTVDGVSEYGIKVIYAPMTAPANNDTAQQKRHGGITLGPTGIVSNIKIANIELIGPGIRYNFPSTVCSTGDEVGAVGVHAFASPGRSNNITLSHLYVHQSDSLVLMNNVDDITIEYSKLEDSDAADTSVGCHPNAAYLGGDNNITFKYNEINRAAAMAFYPSGVPSTSELKVYGNLFRNSPTAVYPANGNGKYYVYNNIFDSTYYSVYFGAASITSGSVMNNIFYPASSIGGIGFNGATHDYNWYYGSDKKAETNGIAAGAEDPFVNRTLQDYRITSAVDATHPRNKGTSLSSEYSLDKMGTTRGADGAWDIGAYEYIGTPDIIAPIVSLTAPTSGSTVSGTINVSANASDNIAVAGVQFKVGTTNIGAEDTTSTYSTSWPTTSVANGSYTLYAVARDAANNRATSTVTVTVNNPTTFPVSLAKAGAGASVSSASSSPAGLNCAVGTTCTTPISSTFNNGTAVVITATPGSGYTVSWSGCESNPTANSCRVTTTANVVATFSNSVGCTGTCKYVKPGGAGNFSGNDWNNAYAELPYSLDWEGKKVLNLARGYTYYFANGDYLTSGVNRIHNNAGTQLITIKKATPTDHGTDTGWTSCTNCGIGQAVIRGFDISDSSYITIDGNYEYGLKLSVPYGGTGVGLSGGAVNSNITIKNVDITGPATSVPYPWRNQATVGVYLNQWSGRLDNLTISHNAIHGFETLIQTSPTVNMIIEYNKLYDNRVDEAAYLAGSPPTAYPNIPTPISAYNPDVDRHDNVAFIAGGNNTTFKFNEIWNWDITGFYPSGGPSGTQKIYGNYFHDGFLEARPIWFFNGVTTGTWLIYNNTFRNLPKSAIELGEGANPSGYAKNNIFYNNGSTAQFGSISHSYNFYSGANQDTTGGIGNGSNPFTGTTAQIVGTIGATYPANKADSTIGSEYSTPINGGTRPSGAWDMGAWEYFAPIASSDLVPNLAAVANTSDIDINTAAAGDSNTPWYVLIVAAILAIIGTLVMIKRNKRAA